MVIDFHVHCFPDGLAARAVAELAERAGTPPRLNGTVSDIKESMKKASVDHSVVLSIATKPSQTEKVNSWAAEIQDKQIISFGSIHPDYIDWKAELVRLKQLGIKGIKFHPDYQLFYVDEKRMMPIYEKAFELDMTVIFHAGLDIGLPAPYHCTPDRLAKLLEAFPDGKWVAAHMGGYSYWDDVERLLGGKNIYLDTSYCFGRINNEQMLRIINNHGYKKILFATDSPWSDQEEEIKKLKALKLSEEAEKAILGLNAKELLNL
ncbi:MAG TPA: amidohydrolase family protein [Clostridia bacterium]|nr:amidohydrolase family protein [Clostridia bacterium]